MALLLAFDTATRHCAVVLSEDARPIAWEEEASERLSHAEHLNVFIQRVMDAAGRTLQDLDAVAVGIGPGSYTGLRIGVSAAKGLCFALDRPLIGMSTLAVLTQEVQATGMSFAESDRLQPMIDARRMEVFTAAFTTAGTAGPATPVVLDTGWLEALPSDRRTVVFGDGADKAAGLWEGRSGVVHVPGIRPAVQGLARCAAAHFAEQRSSDLAYLVPDYGKAPNVTLPKKRTA